MSHQTILTTIIAAVAFVGLAARAQDDLDRGRFTAIRFLEYDTDGDGRLSREELPGRYAERVFSSADANEDGYLDIAEMEVFFARRGDRPDERAAGGRGDGGGHQEASFSSSMRAVGRAMRTLSRSSFDAADRAGDFEALASMQAALIGAKSQLEKVEPSAAARAQFGDDMTAYHNALRLDLLAALMESAKLEAAITQGDAVGAKGIIERIVDMRDGSHAMFRPDEQE